MKQILLQMNAKRPDDRIFVIEDLDQTHLLIKADEEESMREELELEVRFPGGVISTSNYRSSWRRIRTVWNLRMGLSLGAALLFVLPLGMIDHLIRHASLLHVLYSKMRIMSISHTQSHLPNRANALAGVPVASLISTGKSGLFFLITG